MTISRPVNLADPVQRQLLFQSIRALPAGEYDVEVKAKKRGSKPQRGYLHGVVVPIAAAMLAETSGELVTEDDAWEWLKSRFRPREIVDPLTGAAVVVGRSTAELTPVMLYELTDEIIEFLKACGHDVPPPNPEYKRARERAERRARAA